MTRRRMNGLMSAGAIVGIMLTAFSAQAQQIRMVWAIEASKAEDVDKVRAEQVYLMSCQILEDRLEWDGQPIRPRIRVHVGEACPVPGFSGACMNPSLGMLFVPEWNEDAVQALIQITVMTALRQIIKQPKPNLLVM